MPRGPPRVAGPDARALCVLGIRGDSSELAVSYSDELSFADSFDESLGVAKSLQASNANIMDLERFMSIELQCAASFPRH